MTWRNNYEYGTFNAVCNICTDGSRCAGILTALITQVIKEMPGLRNIQTNVVAFVTALILTALAVVIACIYYNITLLWYYIVAAVIASFIVYLVATGGWERVAEIWQRTKFNKHK